MRRSRIFATILLAGFAGLAAAQQPANSGSNAKPNTGPGTPAAAQTSSPNPVPKNRPKPVVANDQRQTNSTSVEGCLSTSGAGQFSIRTRSRDIAVVPAATIASDFASRVGQRVRVLGEWAEGEVSTNTHSAAQGNGNGLLPTDKPTTATPPSNQPGAAAANQVHHFQADSIDMISTTCEKGK